MPQVLRDGYENLTLPTEDEDFDRIEYMGSGNCESANAQFSAWKKDCKLKSRIPANELKKSSMYSERMAEFMKMKTLRHKVSGEQARLLRQKEKDAKAEIREAKKKAKQEKVSIRVYL